MKQYLFRFLCSVLALASILLAERAVRAQAAGLVVVSAATLRPGPVAPGSIATLFGRKLATTTATARDADPDQAGLQLPLSLGGTTVRVQGQLARLLFVSPQQINFIVPPINTQPIYRQDTLVEVVAGDGTITSGEASFANIAPGLFTAKGSGSGLPAGFVLRLRADGMGVNEPLFTFDSGALVPQPVDFGAASDRVVLVLFGTGLAQAPDPNRDGNAQESVRVLLNGYETTPLFVGAAPGLLGVEQINLLLPRAFVGQMRVVLELEVEGQTFTQGVGLPLALPPLGTLAWRAGGLGDKRILSLAGNDTVALAGTAEGIFRLSASGGAWLPASYALPGVLHTNALLSAAFLTAPTVWLAGTSGRGIYTSGDNGTVWTDTPISTFPLLSNQTVLAFGANHRFAFAGVEGLGVARLQCLCSGAKWERASEQFAAPVTALATNGDRVFAGTATSGLYVSDDNGNNWAQSNSGVPLNAEVRALLRLGDSVLAGTRSGLYRSSDNGATWARVTEGVSANVVVNALFAYGRTALAGTAAGVWVSGDGGARWQALNDGLTSANVLSLGLSGNRLLAGTQAGVFVAALSSNVNQLPVAENLEVALDEDTPKALTLRGSDADGDPLSFTITRAPAHGELRGTGANLVYVPEPDYYGVDSFVYRAHDGKLGSRAATVTLNINPVNDPPQMEITGTRLLLVGQFADLTLRLSDPDVLTFSQQPRLTLTAQGLPAGARLTAPSPLLPSVEFRRLIWVPNAPGSFTMTFTLKDETMLSTTQSVTVRVADNQEKGAWTAVNSPIRPPRTDYVANLFVDGNDLYAVTSEQGSLWRSTDGGATWREANTGLGAQVLALVRAGNLLFVGTERGVFRSPAPAANALPQWTAVNNGLPGQAYVHSLAARDNRLVAATSDDVFLSTNQGESWTRITGSLPLLPSPTLPSPTFAALTSVVFSSDALFVSIRLNYGVILTTAQPEETTTDEAEVEAAAPREGVFRSTDNGATWVPVNAGLGTVVPGGQRFLSVTNLTASGTTLYATTSYGLFRSTNQGERWVSVPTPVNDFRLPLISAGTLPGGLASDLYLPPVVVNGRLYLSILGLGVYTAREDAADWLPINLGLDQPEVTRLVVAGTKLYAITYEYTPSENRLGQGTISTRLFARNVVVN